MHIAQSALPQRTSITVLVIKFSIRFANVQNFQFWWILAVHSKRFGFWRLCAVCYVAGWLVVTPEECSTITAAFTTIEIHRVHSIVRNVLRVLLCAPFIGTNRERASLLNKQNGMITTTASTRGECLRVVLCGNGKAKTTSATSIYMAIRRSVATSQTLIPQTRGCFKRDLLSKTFALNYLVVVGPWRRAAVASMVVQIEAHRHASVCRLCVCVPCVHFMHVWKVNINGWIWLLAISGRGGKKESSRKESSRALSSISFRWKIYV